MGFLNPYFLFALAVLAIPVIIHLFHFRRYKTIKFSNIRFLRNIETERKNRNRLKHLLVLTARCLALTCLVLAFALPGCGGKQKISGKKFVRIFLDNSYSMEKRNSEGILFETAKQKARDIVKSMESAAEFQIITNDLSTVHTRYVAASEAIGIIDRTVISARSENLGRIWKWMENHIPEGSDRDFIFYCISDFQAGFVDQITNLSNSENRHVYGIKIPYSETSNIALDSAWLLNPFAIAGEKNRMTFRVSNYGKENVEGLNIKLKAGNITAGLAKINIEKDASATGMIEFTMPGSEASAATLEIDDPNNPFDNILYLGLHSRGNVKVGVSGANRYVLSALKTNTFFTVENVNPAQIKYPENQVVYLISDAVSEATINTIVNFVNQGGRAVFIPGEQASTSGFAAASGSFGFPKFVAQNPAAIKLRKEGLSNPFFNQVFQSVPTNMEMPVIRNYFSTSGSNGSGENIISLENGDPFLLNFKVGKGELYLFTAPLTPKNGNFVESVLFFPIISNCAINSQLTGNLFGKVASGKGYLLHKSFSNEDGDLVLAQDKIEFVPEIQNGSYGRELFIGPYQSKAGFYELRSKSNKETEIIALNDSRKESDPAAASDEQMEQLEKNMRLQWMNPDKAGLENLNKTADSGLWRLFIWLAAAFFAVEVLLLVFWDRVTGNISRNQSATT